MTEPFRVPENLIATVGVGFEKRLVVNVSDIPALCRQECEALRDHLVSFGDRIRADGWIRKRFPEAAPETTQCPSCEGPCQVVTPQPSAEPKLADLPPLPPGFPKTTFDEKTGYYTTDFGALAGTFTPSAGERCKVCGGTGELRVIGPEQNRTIACGCRVPTPTEGERLCNCAAETNVTGPHHVKPCPLFVPTPSAGEEMCRYRNDALDVVCDMRKGHAGAHRFPDQGWRCLAWENGLRCVMHNRHDGDHAFRSVSAGETKCTCPPEALYHHGDCPFAILYHKTPDQTERDLRRVMGETKCGLKGCTLTTPHTHGLERFVGARPEEASFDALRKAYPLVRGNIHQQPSCTACACGKCKDREAFVRALARLELSQPTVVDIAHPDLDKLTGEMLLAARRVTNGGS